MTGWVFPYYDCAALIYIILGMRGRTGFGGRGDYLNLLGRRMKNPLRRDVMSDENGEFPLTSISKLFNDTSLEFLVVAMSSSTR